MAENLRRDWHVRFDDRYKSWQVAHINENGGSQSRSYKTKAEAEAALTEMAKNGRCVECGEILELNYCEPYKTAIQTVETCFNCLFWVGYVETQGNPTHAIIGGRHFVISPDQPKGYRGFLGHGGAEFTIKFHDGREVVSRNLWAQGRVPEHFRGRLPDNAVFVSRGHVAIGPHAGYGGSGSADAAVQG